MKNRVVTGSGFLLAAAALFIGPRTFMKVCTPGENIMKCWWSARAEIGVAVLLAIAALGLLLFQSEEVRLGISYIVSGLGLVTILIPSVLIGGCMKEAMSCRMVGFPGMYVTGVFVIILAVGNCIYLHRKRK